MNKVEFYEDLEKLYQVLPPKVLAHLREQDLEDLIEIVLDLGRVPEIRRSDGRIEYLGKSLSLIHISEPTRPY